MGRTRCKLEAAELTVRLQPDLVLVDLGLAGLATAHRIKADAPAARVLLLTVYDLAGYEAILGKGPVDGVLAKSRFGSDLFPFLEEWFGPANPPAPSSALYGSQAELLRIEPEATA